MPGTKSTKIVKRDVFRVKDCALIAQMGGVEPAVNLRELAERLRQCPVECLFHHFCEMHIRPSFDDPEYRNDLAVWAQRVLRDRVLAERLGIVNPYRYANFEELRTEVIDIIEERLGSLHFIPWAPKGEEFRFMRAVTVVFDSGSELETLEDLRDTLPHMSNSSVYYHFIEARRRTPAKSDDFSAWLQTFDHPPEEVLREFGNLDFHFLNLRELKNRLTTILGGEVES